MLPPRISRSSPPGRTGGLRRWLRFPPIREAFPPGFLVFPPEFLRFPRRGVGSCRGLRISRPGLRSPAKVLALPPGFLVLPPGFWPARRGGEFSREFVRSSRPGGGGAANLKVIAAKQFKIIPHPAMAFRPDVPARGKARGLQPGDEFGRVAGVREEQQFLAVAQRGQADRRVGKQRQQFVVGQRLRLERVGRFGGGR